MASLTRKSMQRLIQKRLQEVPDLTEVEKVEVLFPEVSEDERIVREVMEEPLNEVKIVVTMKVSMQEAVLSHSFGLSRTLDGLVVWRRGDEPKEAPTSGDGASPRPGRDPVDDDTPSRSGLPSADP